MTDPGYIVSRCLSLKNNWTTRDKKFRDWYDILLLEDELEQEGMESVVSNDPRTGYNLAKHLLTTMIIADKIPSEELSQQQVAATSYLEKFISKRWSEQEKRYRSSGRQSWLGELISWMLCTGWFSVFAMVTPNEIWSEVWSPADCFPDFGPDGLVEHAHIYTMSVGAARRKLKMMGWTYPGQMYDAITFYDHWGFDEDGDIANSVVCGNAVTNHFVKAPVKDMLLTKLGRLPVFTSPVGGLPDHGNIKQSGLSSTNTWQKHYGESIIATNEDLQQNYNKMRSFYQQAARYGAQHHWIETSAGDTPIASEAMMDRWGSVLHGAPGEDVRPLQPAAMPVELTQILFMYQNELQRGLFPSVLFGNVQQQMSYLAMANAASASMQVLTPFKDALQGIRSDIDNFWTDMMLENGLNPYKFKEPENLPDRDERLFNVDASIEIPGYMVQRATVSRMLNPNFRLPESWILERMFPEIKNMYRAVADVRKEDAMMHPKAILVDSILAYREQARLAREARDIKTAELYEKLATSLESELSPQPTQPSPQAKVPPTPAEVMPKELTSPLTGLGEIA